MAVSTVVGGAPLLPARHVVRAPPQADTIIKKEAKNPLVESARKYLGVPYEYGGRAAGGKARALDCLGLMFAALQENYGIGWRIHRGVPHWNTTPSILIRQLDKAGKNTQAIVPGCSPIPGQPAARAQASLRSLRFPPLLVSNRPARELWEQEPAFGETPDTLSQKQLESYVLDSLKPGDLLFFLSPVEPQKPHDVPAAKDQYKRPLYVWHTGIYAGDSSVLHASPPEFKDRWGNSQSRVCEESLVEFLKANGFSGFVRVRYVHPQRGV
jgi:cell wall-associated NlpC family hydrolase